MGLFYRNKSEEIKTNNKNFKIPQFIKIDGLKQPGRRKYKPSEFVSPIFGVAVKDEVVAPFVNKATGDLGKQFDFIRENPMKDRSTYEEFKGVMITNKTREEVFGKDVHVSDRKYVDERAQEKEITIPFKGRDNQPKFDQAIKEEKPTPIFTKPFKGEVVKEEIPKEIIIETPTQVEEVKVEYEVVEEVKEVEVLKPTFVEPEEVITPKEQRYEEVIEKQEPAKPKRKPKRRYQLPPYSIFSVSERNQDDRPQWVLDQEEAINNTLEQFNVPGKVINIIKGPTVTRHEIELDVGVNVNKVSQIKDNLMMNLAAETIRIEAPIPGKPYVGIELPNKEKEMVMFGNVINDPSFKNDVSNPLKVALGVNIDGRNIFENIANMPHGLIAGATNSGKSVCINTVIASLLIKNHPDDLKFIMVDPKMVELLPYGDLPHLLTPVITDPKVAATALNWTVDEMERRYKQFSELRVKDIKSFNERAKEDDTTEFMPYIVVIIDELADLMAASAQEVEVSIQRLTAKARAAGIHLIVATQRPTTDVVKGTIKANIPTRVAFRVSSYVDSITILDQQGAEQLLGKGDMLLKGVDRPVRLQGAYLKDKEIEELTNFIRNQLEPNYAFTHEKLAEIQILKDEADEEDPLFYQIAEFIIEQQSCSINAISKEFALGFNRAQKIVNMFENRNFVSKNEGTKARSVLITKADLDRLS